MKNLDSQLYSLDSLEKREKLLQLNPDLLYGVYYLLEEDTEKISLKIIDNVMTCYQNQFQKLQIPEESSDIVIIDLESLRKGKVKCLKGTTVFDSIIPILLSGGVLEYIKGRTGKKHLITTLRDGCASDSLQYTTTAGRNTGEDVGGEVEREHYEEGPFLGKNEKGDYILVISGGNRQGKEYTKRSIELFLERKYSLDESKQQDKYFIERFERNFPGVSYSELGSILKNILENDRFLFYEWEEGIIPGIEEDIRTIKLGKYTIDAYCFYDGKNNTLEYRQVREIIKFPENFQKLGKTMLPCKLFLESFVQNPGVPRIENAGKKSVPVIREVAKKVSKAL